ncbi:unnamed protein product [Fraxinus pennsylvanica]|uniref:Uncharacterized protein n=1 Tax=Fraxinus pennsylvanica TaxID=56036 RepID=A0AAD2DKW9_9LAMI|nr:unnamed protein product [Fraxinus pennsylvanica]
MLDLKSDRAGRLGWGVNTDEMLDLKSDLGDGSGPVTSLDGGSAAAVETRARNERVVERRRRGEESKKSDDGDCGGGVGVEKIEGRRMRVESVRVSNELGAANPKSAAFSVVVVNTVSVIVSVLVAAIVLWQRHNISYIFTNGTTVSNAVSELCPCLGVTLILNGIQPVLSRVAVGCGWQAFVAYVNVGCFYIVGVPVGCLLGFKFNFGIKIFMLVGNMVRNDWRNNDANHHIDLGDISN